MTTRHPKDLPVAEDVTPKTSPLGKLGRLALGLLVTVGLAAGGWWGYKNIYEMSLLRQSLNDAVELMRPDLAEEALTQVATLNEAQLAHFVASNISAVEVNVTSAKRTEFTRSAIELGKRLNYSRILTLEARLMEAGILPGYSEDEIRSTFIKALDVIKERTKSGEAQEVLAYFELLYRGKAYLPESTTAAGTLVNALSDLTDYDFDDTPVPFLSTVTEMTAFAREKLRRNPDFSKTDLQYHTETFCERLHPIKDINDFPIPARFFQHRREKLQVQAKCITEVLAPYIQTNPDEFIKAYADDEYVLNLIVDQKPTGFIAADPNIVLDSEKPDSSKNGTLASRGAEPSSSSQWWKNDPVAVSKPAKETSNPLQIAEDQIFDAKTGYVRGEPIRHKDGLSSFEVDNTGTNRDAIVRIYFDGKKPAARSMLVKAGEKFTAKTLSPGKYKMRYRFSDSKKIFEAKSIFAVTEEKTETGTRFSRITVTLYKTKDGNMQTTEVSEDDF